MTFQTANPKNPLDLLIIGAGPSGLAAAIEAHKSGLSYVVLEKGCLTNSIFHFPTQMIFFTSPELLEIGGMPLVCEREKPSRNEALKYYRKVAGAYGLKIHQYEEVLHVEQTAPHSFLTRTGAGAYASLNVVIAIGYYDNPNMLNVPGENRSHVSHYYSEGHAFCGRDVVVIGGKNSAVDAALELFRSGARVSLVHRGSELGQAVKYWIRPDIENRFKAGQIRRYFNAEVQEITDGGVRISQNGDRFEIPAQHVFAMTGYHPSMRFFDQLGVRYDAASLRPDQDPESFETNVSGVYLAGSVAAGRQNGEIFIENGRFHGSALVKDIARRLRGLRK